MADLSDPARLAALHASGLVGLSEEERRPFDRLARIAGAQLDVPVAAVTVLDATRRTLVATHGVDRFTCDADDGLCRQVVRRDEPLVIADSRLDPAYGPDSSAARQGVIA